MIEARDLGQVKHVALSLKSIYAVSKSKAIGFHFWCKSDDMKMGHF